MALILSEEQEMLRDAARRFLSEHSPVSAARALRDSGDELGYSRQLWNDMAEMGWAGIMVPEVHGGLEFGLGGAAVVLEEMGRTLCASPFLSSCVIAPVAMQAGSNEQQAEILPKLAAGELVIALALEEGAKHGPANTKMQAEKKGNGYTLSGEKGFVFDGLEADKFLTLARTSGEPGDADGLSLFLVDAKADGLTQSKQKLLDSRNYARLAYDNVDVDGGDLIGEEGKGLAALEPALNAGRIGLAAEMLGASGWCFDSTVSYLKERTQFGQVIGTFQGLQHRSAHLYSELELVRSAVLKAGQDFEANPAHAGLVASLAKAKAGEVAILAANEGVQMHGGMGMTDEFDMGLFMKRIRAAQELLGDYSFHADRFAQFRGY